MLCNKRLFSAVTGIGVYNCRNDLMHGDRLVTRVLTLRLLSHVCFSYCPKDSCFSTEFMYFFCMQTSEQLDHQVQLYFFRQYLLLSSTCFMFQCFCKAIIRYKHKIVEKVSIVYTKQLLIKKDWDLSLTVT
jgi:hypothetical protein